MSSTQLTLLIISLNVATCFNQLHGHPQVTHAYKTKITIANFIFSWGGGINNNNNNNNNGICQVPV